MILTTPTKQPYTTTKHNHKGYIFTLYLFMLLCVVGNCLLFYCSCTGNCENCCGINGSIKDKSESAINNDNNNIKYNKVEKKIEEEEKKEEKEKKKVDKKEEKKIEVENKEDDKIEINIEKKDDKKKKEEKKEEWKENNKIKNENQHNNVDDSENKLEEIGISNDGKIGNIQIVNAEFVKKKLGNVLIKKLEYEEGRYKELGNNFIKESIKPICGTYLSAYVEVKKYNKIQLQCFIECKNANSISENGFYYGLFHGSEATKIEILSCGSEIKDMNCMFCQCSSLTELDLSNFTTENVTNMRNMFSGCSSLTILDLSNFNTKKVTYMSFMFYNCNSLNNLDLSKFNTTNVTNMMNMFKNCFKEKQISTLICKASTLKKITENENSSLTITKKNENEKKDAKKEEEEEEEEEEKEEKKNENDNENKINDGLNKNSDQVCICSVKREGKDIDPKIISVYKFKDMPSDGRIEGKQIVRKEFVNLVKYVPIGSDGDKQELEKIIESIKPTGETYLSAYVAVEKDNKIQLQCFIYCTDANSRKGRDDNYYGLFQNSEATKIEILSCGSEIKNMLNMFFDCSSLTNLNLSKFNTQNVTDMYGMFSYCSSLKELDLSSFNTTNVTNMSYMFNNCSSLTKLDLSNFNTSGVKYMGYMFNNCSSLKNLDLSKFNTDNVTYMSLMFYDCFQNNAKLMCQASTIQKITDKTKFSWLTIQNEKKNEINEILNNNQLEVYTCSVNIGGSNPEITGVKEYKSQK